jgi:hypothetical protein
MIDKEPRQRLADLIELVIEGELYSADALKQAEKWEDMPWERRDVNLALHTLMQFHIYENSREKYPDYDEGVRQRLRLYISNLRCPPG